MYRLTLRTTHHILTRHQEFSTSNFIAITKDGRYITPDSNSVLDSATNRVLEQCARDLGMPTERRKITYDEVGSIAEVGACGTAVVLTPVTSLTRGATTHRFPSFATLEKLRARVLSIQQGEIPDTHGWLHGIDA